MSSVLQWEVHRRKREDLPNELKWLLQERYGGPIHKTFTDIDLEFLRGLSTAKVKGADTLIKAIEKHGEIDLDECW